MKSKYFVLLALVMVLAIVVTGCRATPEPTEVPPPAPPETEEAPPPEAEIDCMGGEGSEVSMLAVWTGDEEARLIEIFQPLIDACDITFTYEGTRDLNAILATRVEGGNPPDISLMPNVGAFEMYKDKLIPLDDLGAHLENYLPSWLALGSVEGTVYGVFVKADVKSLVWYSPTLADSMGYEIPSTWDEFVAGVEEIKADGLIPFSMGMESGAATGWTGTDFVQDIMMRTQGVDFVNGLAVHDTAWNDPAVKEAWEIYGKWATDPTYALGGSEGTVSTGFLEAIYATFADPPQAVMVKQSGFAGGIVEGQYPELEFGTDYDFFVIPSMDGSPPPVQVGGDAMAVFNDAPAVRALVAYLTSEMGGKAWAASGFDLSPNNKVTGEDYTDPISAAKADVLAAAPAVSYDVGDLLPGGMVMDEFVGITEYVNGGDLDSILDRLEDRAVEIFGGLATIDCMGGEGSEVSMLAVWTGDEEARLIEIFQPLIDACDITFTYEGTRDLNAILATRVEGGNPPDISLMPNVGAFTQYKDDLIPLDTLGANLDNYSPSWLALGTVDGEVVGIFVKSDVKSLAWYSPIAFDAMGYKVPKTWADFEALVDQIKADGGIPFSMGMESGAATGWTGTDFVQDILLRTQGVEFTDGLATGATAWNDPGVKEAWELYGNWAADPTYALGGADGTVSTGFLDAIYAVFADPPQAFMVKQSGFAGGIVEGQYPELVFGTDFAFFVLPSVDGSPPPVQVGADAMAVFNDTPAVRALVAYLTSGRGGRAWAASGFDLSPNNKVTGLSYTDPISAAKAGVLLRAPAVSFDVGDLLPGGMVMDEFAAITEYVGGGDLDTILTTLQARADEVFAE
ncbi:MAG: extracellular solute-binding protein [Anaerolineales bacterium]|nr:extracellular solute-binding protein [Anaerolineales bacterium]